MDISLDKEDILINVRVGDSIETIDLRQDLRINDKALSDEFINQPGTFAWYSALLADQEEKMAEAKREYSRYTAKISLLLRQGKKRIIAIDGKPIKVTDSVQESYILNDSTCNTFLEDLNRLEVIVRKLKVLKDASIQRKDMLMQVGALKRAEMEQFGIGVNGVKQ